MKVRKSSDNSIRVIFNNVDIDICYPLIRLGLTGTAFKLDTEISYYKFSNHKLKNYSSVVFKEDYDFTFIILGFGFIVTVTKDIQRQDQ